MKTQLISAIAIIMLFIFPKVNFAQLPDLGAASGFVLYTAGGAFNAEIADISVVTGDVGTNAGAFFGFPPGTLTGQKHVADAVTAQAAIDVASAYNQLSVRNEIMYTFVEIQNVCKQTILINRSIKKYFLI